jgi:hypothetical protein
MLHARGERCIGQFEAQRQLGAARRRHRRHRRCHQEGTVRAVHGRGKLGLTARLQRCDDDLGAAPGQLAHRCAVGASRQRAHAVATAVQQRSGHAAALLAGGASDGDQRKR